MTVPVARRQVFAEPAKLVVTLVAVAAAVALVLLLAGLRRSTDRVLWLEDGRFKTLQTLVREPVCGMLIDPAEAPASIEQGGAPRYFCSRGCRDEFLTR